MSFNLQKAHLLCIFFCLMPYVGLGFLPSDTQPFALILSAFFVYDYLYSNKTGVIVFLFIAFLAIFTLSLLSFSMQLSGIYGELDTDIIVSIRSIAAYATPLLISVSTYYYMKMYGTDKLHRVVDVANRSNTLLFFLEFSWIY